MKKMKSFIAGWKSVRGTIVLLLLSTTIIANCQDSINKYPVFNWDKIPVYIHFGHNGGLSDEEIEFVATHSDFVCFEKGHGTSIHGSTEKGIEADAARLKQFNPDVKVIYYWNTFLDYNMYDAHKVYQEHHEWWLIKMDGTLDKKGGKLMRYDLSNPEVREWWAEEVRKAVVDGSCEGVFMDAFPQITNPENIELWGQEKYDAIQAGLIDLIELTRKKIGPENLIVYNGIRNTDALHYGMQFLDITDASTMEHFDQFASRDKENVVLDIENMIEAGKKGQIVVMKGWPDFNWTMREKMRQPYEELLEEARNSITFPLACFLIAAQPYSYFCYSWGYREKHGSLDWYPVLDNSPGEPLGQAERKEWIYTRKFENCDVWVDIESKKAKITWKN
ncbi:putative glycoside hydrolase [Bacteroidota bacterium]